MQHYKKKCVDFCFVFCVSVCVRVFFFFFLFLPNGWLNLIGEGVLDQSEDHRSLPCAGLTQKYKLYALLGYLFCHA